MKKQYIYTLLFVVLGFGGCKNFEEINTNPNIPNTNSPDELFTYALHGTTGHLHETYRLNSLTSLPLAFQFYDNHRNAATYGDNSQVFAGEYWKRIWVRVIAGIEDTNAAIDNSDYPDKEVLHAVTSTWKILNLSRLTDLYGHIPYQFGGLSTQHKGEEYLKPVYDKQVDVYNDMITTLKENAAVLKNGGTNSFGQADIIFNGDNGKWEMLANSLRLRLANRIGNNSEVTSALSANLIDENSNSCNVPHQVGDPWAPITNGDYAIHFWWDYEAIPSAAIVNVMSNYTNEGYLPQTFELEDGTILVTTGNLESDPRMDIFFRYGNNPALHQGHYYSIPHGQVSHPDDYYDGKYALVGDRIFAMDAPAILLDAAEVSFIKAEVNLDKAAFKKGIEQSFTFYELLYPGQSIDAKYPEFWNRVSTEFDNDPLAAIGTQKWIATFTNGPESYSEYRRNGYPVLKEGIDFFTKNDGTTIPMFIDYPMEEYQRNSANVNAASSDRKGYWWDGIIR